MINIVSSSRYVIDRKRIREFAARYLKEKGLGEEYVLNIVFVGRNKMKAVSSRYKGENVALPVLSFPYKNERIEDGKILGELMICYPQAVLLSAERSKKVDDIIFFLIKHGIDNLLI